MSELSSYQVDCVYLLRLKKKGTVKHIRNMRKVTINTSVIERRAKPEGGMVDVIKADFDHKWGSGRLIGEIDKVKGTVRFDLVEFTPKGYLRGRDFFLAGYDMKANITNLGQRRNAGVDNSAVKRSPRREGGYPRPKHHY